MWTQCRLSAERLQLPCCADELGSLFNKDAVVTALVTKVSTACQPPASMKIAVITSMFDLHCKACLSSCFLYPCKESCCAHQRIPTSGSTSANEPVMQPTSLLTQATCCGLQAMPKALSHITSLKHLINLQLTPNAHSSASSRDAVAAGAQSTAPPNEAEFCCPITGTQMNGVAPFVVLQPSGVVVSERALKQVRQRPGQSSAGLCMTFCYLLLCGHLALPQASDQTIIILPAQI